jgi:serine phosphatase RsbU (regulator of sigma subunit)/Tfp pilus assembly protein PilF
MNFLQRLILILICLSFQFKAQDRFIDSLVSLLQNPKEDSNTVKIQNNLAWYYLNHGDNDNCLKYVNEARILAKKINFKKGEGKANSIIGGVYYRKGDFDKALEYYYISLKIREEANDKLGISASLNNIGVLYDTKNDYKHSKEIYLKSIKIKEEIGDLEGAAFSYMNIGIIYYRTDKYDTAIQYESKALEIFEKLGVKRGAANCYSNLGNIYMSKNDHDKAFDYYFKALKLRKEIDDKDALGSSYLLIGSLYLRKKQALKAREYLQKCLEIGKEISAKPIVMQAYKGLSRCDSLDGNYKNAYINYQLFSEVKDSIYTAEVNEETAKAQALYETEKKDKEIQLLNKDKETQAVISLEESKKQKIIIISVVSGLLLLLIFSGFMYNRFKVTQKQKHIIETQKEIVEEKHKEITDSINYAERIQRSFLATKELLDENLSDYFVFFQPKDIVSGDFYWANKLINGKFLLATADSTGHGVPGAIMSILNISCLEKSLEEEKLKEPGEILNHTRKKIIERLKKDGTAGGGKDGMDCSLVCFDFQNSKLIYAAANNPVLIVRNNEIIELKPDKMPVGKHDKDQEPFTQHEINLQKGDVVYTLTDGMPDQFGGIKGKKFMYKQLKELLISVAHLPMFEQKEILKTTLYNWKGDLEQVDDICLIGVRI